MFHAFTGYDTLSFFGKKKLHGRLGKHIQMSLYGILCFDCKINTENHWHNIMAGKSGEVHACMVLLYDHISSQVSVNDAGMHPERRNNWWNSTNKSCTCTTYYACGCLPSWSQLGLSNNCFSRATITKWMRFGTRTLMGNAWEVHWIILLEATQACCWELMWLQELLQRTLQVSESCSRVYCTLLLWWLILTVMLIEPFHCYMQ